MNYFLRSLPFLLLLGIGTPGNAQVQSILDCFGKQKVCNNTYSQTTVSSNVGVQELGPNNAGCLSIEHHPNWYVVNVTSPGQFTFTLTPLDPNDDYDFAVWDITGVGCKGVQDSVPLRCNYATNAASGPNGTTGLDLVSPLPSYGPGGPGFSSAITATVGQSFAILVDNFSASTAGYTLDFFTNNGASIYDTVKPFFLKTATKCGTTSDTLEVVMSEDDMLCDSLAPDGSDFYITPAVPGISIISATSTNCTAPGNQYLSFKIRFSAVLPPGSYYLHAKKGSDGNTQLDFCGNHQSESDSLMFTMAPPGPPEIAIIDTPACIRATIILSKKAKCSTIAADGSDFKLTGPSAINITSAIPRSCVADLADTIDLTYDKAPFIPGIYTFTFPVGTDGNGIMDTCGNTMVKPFPYNISENGYITIDNASPLIVCNPAYITLSSSIIQPVSAVMPGFKWYGPNLSDSTVQYPTAYIARTSDYMVQIVDSASCYRRARLQVIVPIRNPRVLSPDTAICLGDNVTLQLGGGQSYRWYPSTGLSCTDCANPVASPLVNTIYYGIVYDQYGCSDTVSTTIKVNPLPVVAVNAGRDTGIVYAQSVNLYARSLGGKFFTWEPITGLSNPNIPNPIATPAVKTRYTVYVTDTNQCRANASIVVDVNRTIPVSIPSGFTPNDDGRNDFFRITNLTFQKVVEFRVYNRWGEQVYHSNDNTGWDGRYKGVKQDVGSYQYLIRVGYPDGTIRDFKGDVTLIR